MNPTDVSVISIGYIHGGQAFNVIPGTVDDLCIDTKMCI